MEMGKLIIWKLEIIANNSVSLNRLKRIVNCWPTN